MGGATPEQLAANARAAAEEGFTAIKFDPIPAGFQDMTLEGLVAAVVERVAAAREAVGKDVDLITEFHRKLTPLQAVPVAEAIARFHPLFIEDPIQIDSIQSQAEIARRISSALANGERMHSIWEFRELLVYGGSQYVRPDVGLAGGLTHCKKIAAIAESFHAAVVTHNFLGPVLTAASVHLDVSIPNFVVQEYSKADEGPVATAFPGALKRTGGYLPVPDAPGLGVKLDEARLKEVGRPLWDPMRNPLRADGSVAYAV
jgi:galactonate dehydratase